jgi:pyruvate formate lyase activating enzyme
MNISGSKGLHEARFWKTEGERIGCYLCPHHCKIADELIGICGVRQNIGGRLYSLIYGKVSAVHVDPIEKKPLFHFKPGTPIFSLGSVGCNLRCLHCQNYSISQSAVKGADLRDITPEQAVELTKANSCDSIAFTYNEPSIWHEFSYDTCVESHRAGVSTVYVSNGFIESEPLREIAPYLDAMNIDIKGFDETFYRGVCKARLAPVLAATKLAHELGIHVELTYLVIPGKNDREEEIRAFCHWARTELGPKVPVHFSRFHPDYMMADVPATPPRTMEMTRRVAREEGLAFAYIGNMATDDGENTYCPRCSSLLIRRSGYSVEVLGLTTGHCPKCGEDLNLIL